MTENKAYKSVVIALGCLAELSECSFDYQWSAFCFIIQGLDEFVQEFDAHYNIQLNATIILKSLTGK